MNEQAECPICFARITATGDSATNLSFHMSTHSKEEVVAALLGRTRPPTPQQRSVESASASQALNLSSTHNTLISGQLLQQAIQTTPSIRPSQLQAQGGFFSGGGITLSPIQDGSIAQNQLKSGTSTPLAPVSSGFHNNGLNIISSLAPTNSTVGSSPKIVPTIATTAFPTSSRPQQISINSENSIITNASDNRNGLVNVQLQQGPILIPSSNANITSSLPIQSVVTAVPPVATAQENTACSVQTGPASVQGGLMQVMGSTPCLIPQPNGLPPLIVNVPTANYVQVPTQPPSGCNLPLVSSLLAANILANTNMLNGGVNNILNQPNNNAPRPTLVTSSDNALFIAPPTLPGLNTGSTNVSTANINLNNLVACPQPRASLRPQIQVIHHTSSENKSNEAILASLDVPAGTAGIVLQKHSTDTTSNPSSLLASAVSPMEGDRKRLLLLKCQQPTSRSGTVPSSTGSVVDPLSVVSHALKDSIEDVESPSNPQDNGILRHISNIHSYSKENEYEVKKGARTDGMEILGCHKSPPPSSTSNYLQPHTQGFSDGLTNTTAWTDPQGGDSIESSTRQSKNSGKCSKNSMNKGKKLKKLSVHEPEALGKSGSAEKQPFIPEPEDSSDVGQDEVDTSRVTVDQTDSLNGSNTESMNVSSDPKCNEVTLKSKIEIQEDQIKMEGAQLNSLSTPSFSFTQYAADSPYPAASLNFSSVWNNLVPQGERKDSKVGPMSPSSSSRVHEKVHEINTTNIKKEVVGSDYIAPIDTINNMNSSMAPSLIKSEIVAEEDSLTNDSEDVSVPSFNNNHSQSRTSKDEGNSTGNVRTVQTIADLQKALKSEDDVQIVVPNELLETTEFKTFISNFNSFPINDRHQNVQTASASSKESKSTNVRRELAENPSFQQTMEGVIPAPPNNTPVTTRPPSVEIPEDRVVLNRIEYIENTAQNPNKGIEGYVSRMDITTTDATKMVMRQGVLGVIPRNGQGLTLAISPQPGTSRDSNEKSESPPKNTQLSPSKRKTYSLQSEICHANQEKKMNEDEESVSISNQSSRMGHEGDDEEEDDITLQDLVAMETMDDADELDITSENSLQSEHELYQHLKGSHHTVKNDDSLAKSIKTLATGNRNDIFTSRYFGGSNVGDPIKSQTTATARVSQNPTFQNTGTGGPSCTSLTGSYTTVGDATVLRCEKCGISFVTEEDMRLHSIGAGDSSCIASCSNTNKQRPRKGPTGIGKKSGVSKGRSIRKDSSNKNNLEQATTITFENDDANMSRPVSPSRSREHIAIADCMITEPVNCAIDVNNLKVEAHSLSSTGDVFKTSSIGGIYDYSNSLSSNASISLPIAIKSEAVYDSNSQPALGAASSRVDTWKCNQCKVAFESGPQLLEHLDEIRRAEHKCPSCCMIFESRKSLFLHRRKLHPSLPKIKSETSSTSTISESGIKGEPFKPTAGDLVPKTEQFADLLPNANGEYTCDRCDRAFKDKELLYRHAACHDEEKPFECLECGKKFAKAGLLRDHRKRHFEVGAFECGYCKKRFYTPNKLREHVRIHTGETPLSCPYCGKCFKRHSNLSEHKRIHMENRPVKPPKQLFCHCGKIFTTQRDLDWHKEGEHDTVPKKCKFCGEVFVHGSSLTRHVRLKHEKSFVPSDKKSSLYAPCPICKQTFYKTSINKHIRIKHQGQKPFECEVCKQRFVTKCNLINHEWQHKQVRSRPFKCQLCRKAYLRQNLLDAHMRSHRGVKPFVCNECGLQFANKSNWQRHVAEHSGARNFCCPRCDKRFSRGYYLTDHMKTHTGEKPYACGICGKTAATRSNYNSHLRTHITREPVNSEV